MVHRSKRCTTLTKISSLQSHDHGRNGHAKPIDYGTALDVTKRGDGIPCPLVSLLA